MKFPVRSSIVVLALLASAGLATAATNGPSSANSGFKLTTAQERNLYQSVSKPNIKAPAGFKASVGETVPDSMSLKALPRGAIRRVPAVKNYDYAMVENELLIVNPKTKKVVDIITH